MIRGKERGTDVNAFKNFLKTTVVGGLMFLVPVVLIIVVLKHAMQFASKGAVPIAANFPMTKVAGIGVVPQSPTPMSGSVMYVDARRVRPLQISRAEAMKLAKSVGVGFAKALRGVDLVAAREG